MIAIETAIAGVYLETEHFDVGDYQFYTKTHFATTVHIIGSGEIYTHIILPPIHF